MVNFEVNVIEKMVEMVDEEVDLVIVVVHEEVIMIVRFRKFDRLKDIYELNLNLFDKNGNSVHRLERYAWKNGRGQGHFALGIPNSRTCDWVFGNDFLP